MKQAKFQNLQSVQRKIGRVFRDAFGRTSLTGRLEDIQREALELSRYLDLNNLREEAGDLLTSTLQLLNECGWSADEVIAENLKKIKARKEQYHTLGRKLRVAVLGGAFNPITTGHIEVAKFVLNASREFDEVHLMPCYKHMHEKKMVGAKHRLNMCKLAAQADGRIKVSDFEIKLRYPGETYHIVKTLLENADSTQYAFIIGLDNANTFHTWVNFEKLERLARFVVISRPGIQRNKKVDWYLKEPHIFLEADQEISETSSTNVREMVVRYWETPVLHRAPYWDKKNTEELGLNPQVWKYIKEHDLYKIKG